MFFDIKIIKIILTGNFTDRMTEYHPYEKMLRHCSKYPKQDALSKVSLIPNLWQSVQKHHCLGRNKGAQMCQLGPTCHSFTTADVRTLLPAMLGVWPYTECTPRLTRWARAEYLVIALLLVGWLWRRPIAGGRAGSSLDCREGTKCKTTRREGSIDRINIQLAITCKTNISKDKHPLHRNITKWYKSRNYWWRNGLSGMVVQAGIVYDLNWTSADEGGWDRRAQGESADATGRGYRVCYSWFHHAEMFCCVGVNKRSVCDTQYMCGTSNARLSCLKYEWVSLI